MDPRGLTSEQANYLMGESSRAFRVLSREALPGPMPRFVDATLERRMESGELRARLRCVTGDGSALYSELLLSDRLHWNAGRNTLNEIESICGSSWSRACDDHEIERQTAGLRAAVLEAQRIGAPCTLVSHLQNQLAETEQTLRIHMDAHPMLTVSDGLSALSMRAGAINMVDNPRRLMAQAMAMHAGMVSAGPPMTATEVRLRQGLAYRELSGRLGEFDRDSLAHLLGEFGGYGDDPKAVARGAQLLKDNLTPDQLAMYERERHFEVVGSDTGVRYRILKGRQMNVLELDAAGQQYRKWCFLPEGGLVEGDCMLAQKIALENYENKAIGIANLISGPPRSGLRKSGLESRIEDCSQRQRAAGIVVRAAAVAVLMPAVIKIITGWF